MNHILKTLWPHYNQAVGKMVLESAKPYIDDICNQVNLGSMQSCWTSLTSLIIHKSEFLLIPPDSQFSLSLKQIKGHALENMIVEYGFYQFKIMLL